MKTIIALTFALCLFAWGCASMGPRSASGTPIDPEALIQAEQLVVQENIPDPLRDDFVALYSEGPQNSVLHAMRAGLGAIRLREWTLAKKTLDRAIRDIESLQEGTEQAERAKSKFVAEKEKWFKGEPYERAALYFYRGLLYLQDQDFGNAAACFRRSQIQDITGEETQGFAGDWASDEIGLALASYLNQRPNVAQSAMQRITTFSTVQGKLLKPQPTHNFLIVVEVGDGPLKYSDGRYSEKLKFRERPTSIQQIRVQTRTISTTTAAAENLYVQATTRGIRQIDYILADKSSFKEDTENATVGLAAATVTAAHVEKTGIAAGVLALATLGTAIASSASHPEADTRMWDTLPHSIYLIPLTLPADVDEMTIEGLDDYGRVIHTMIINQFRQQREGKLLGMAWIRM